MQKYTGSNPRVYYFALNTKYFLFLVLILTFQAYSQEVRFKHLTINDGLSQNAVYGILQDSKGFMWFGTNDGLNRFNGYSFTVFNYNPFDTTTISANNITKLFEDSRGLIWVGTRDAGVNIFRYETGSFERLSFNPGSPGGLNPEITSIVEDPDSNIWIGTSSDGLFKIIVDNTRHLYSYKHFKKLSDSIPGTSSDKVYSLLVDSKGVLWAGTQNMLYRFYENKEDLNQFVINSKNPVAPSDPNEKGITSIYEDKHGNFWLGTLSGLVLFDRQSGKYQVFPHHYDVFRYGWGVIDNILEDNAGKLWLGTVAELMRFDPGKKTYSYFRNDPFNPNSLSYNIISSLFQDRTGILWFGTSGGGINIYDPKANRFSTFERKKEASSRITGFSIRSILEENYNVLWISTDVLYRWNRTTGDLKSYESSSDNLNAFGNTGAWSMIKSSDGKIWVGSTEGLFRYDPLTEKAKQYKFNPKDSLGLPQRNVCAVVEDKNDRIWIATENYICCLTDIEKGIFKKYNYRHETQNSEQARVVIYQDLKNNFWLGTKSGLIKFDLKTELFTFFSNNPADPASLNDNYVKTICADPFEPSKYLWIGTAGGGLNQFSIEKKTFTHYMESDGLPNNVVYGILPDNIGNLWLSTNKGLSRFNIKTKTFRNFNVSDGLQSNEFNTGAFFKSKSGEMFFGGINGLNYFYPGSIKDNLYKPEIVITGFKILNSSSSSKEKESVIQKTITQIKHITLSYDEDFIQFEFAALDYSASEKNQYAYILENFNKDWIYSRTVRTATFTNLSPGEYIFRVKGSNNDGIWNQTGTSILITITHPWWSTWWAYVVYGVVFFSILYFIRKYELNRIFLKSQLELETVKSFTLSNLDQMKSRFFANISHEFRTPLTLILGQIESVMSSGMEAKDKGKLQIANRNARRLLALINQLLDLSKIEAGSMQLKAEQHNIVSFLKSLFYSFESLAESQKISLKFESEFENIPVFFEPDKMEKVFYNLLSNAFKFTSAGEIKVSLNIINSFIEIKIKDSGIGIPPERLANIFDRFYQVDSSSTREHEGTGIGLALAKELIELHKGNISVKSKEGEGSEFIIQLPAGDLKIEKEYLIGVPDDDFSFKSLKNILDTNVNEKGTEIINKVSENNKEIILIVEDNPDVRAYIIEQLETDYKVISASNGEEGIDKAQDKIPDLIITDIMMPRMNGFEFSKRIRSDEKTSHVPIIMLTAKAGLDDKIEGLETGIDVYLTKPFNAKELMVRVKNLIYQRKLLRKKFSSAIIIKPSEVSAVSVDQIFLEKTMKIIEAHFEDEQFGVEALAEEVNMSLSQLSRKLNALIDQPPGQLIRSFRLLRAADLLKHNIGSIAEVCYKVGFNDQAYFSRAFKKQFGCSPSEFKKNHESAGNT